MKAEQEKKGETKKHKTEKTDEKTMKMRKSP